MLKFPRNTFWQNLSRNSIGAETCNWVCFEKLGQHQIKCKCSFYWNIANKYQNKSYSIMLAWMKKFSALSMAIQPISLLTLTEYTKQTLQTSLFVNVNIPKLKKLYLFS